MYFIAIGSILGKRPVTTTEKIQEKLMLPLKGSLISSRTKPWRQTEKDSIHKAATDKSIQNKQRLTPSPHKNETVASEMKI